MASTDRTLHPNRGPHDPKSGTPARRPGSVRRTTSNDSRRPEGLTGPVFFVASGRDLVTAADDSVVTAGEARLEGTVDYGQARTLTALSCRPPAPGVEGLVGLSTAKGFRRAIEGALPGEAASHSLRYQLLDDVPTALLVSGYSLSAARAIPVKRQLGHREQFPDLCAGWAADGVIIQMMRKGETIPIVTGPEAPAIVDPADPAGWHSLGSLGPHDMRRLRRIDAWVEGDQIVVDAFFRDSHVDPDGLETVIHEYGIGASLDRQTLVFNSCQASIGALPWSECPGAIDSATRLVGLPAGDLRNLVRKEFVGKTTCTHLNDTLRALEDVPALAGLLFS